MTNTVLRCDLTERFEVSALIEYRTELAQSDDEEQRKRGVSGMDLGFSYYLHTGKGFVPSVGFQLRVRMPVLSSAYEIKNPAPRFLFVTGQKIGKRSGLITNFGASWNGSDGRPIGNYAVKFTFPIDVGGRITWFLENYGRLRRGTYATFFDTGLAWLITNDMQLDLFGGYGDNQGIKDSFISLGLSFRTIGKGGVRTVEKY